MNNTLFGFLILFSFSLLQCSKESKETKKDIVVILQFDSYLLTQDQILELLPRNLSETDSIEWVNTYKEKWLKDKLLLIEAKKNLDKSTKNKIEEKVDSYKDDLLLNEYTNNLLQKLDKDSIQQNEIEQYFRNNLESFILNKDVLQFQFFTVLNKDAKQALPLFGSTDTRKQNALIALSEKQKLPYYITDSTVWNTREDLLSFTQSNFTEKIQNRILRKNQFFTIQKGDYTLFLKILAAKNKGEKAPMNYVKTTIKNILINKRKLNLLSDLKQELYNDAIESEKIKKSS